VIPGAQNLNDVTSDNSGNLYVTEVFGTRIFKVRLSDSTYTTFVNGNGIANPNGITFDESNNRLLVCSYRAFSPIQAINLADSTVSVVKSTNLHYCDGIAQDNEDNVYVTSWNTNSIYRFDPTFGNPPELIYTNPGGPADISSGDPVNDGGSTQGVSWVDYDNDGFQDLFVTNLIYLASQNNCLYHNDGNGLFTKITGGSIVNDGGYSRTSTWGDYDNDGNLDVYVANWPDQENFLYHNDGNGIFTKISTGALVTEIAGSPAAGWGDYDNDGDLDLFVANYGTNSLFRNDGGTFFKITQGEIVTDMADSYSASWADFDGDGDFDLFVSNPDVNQNNRLYRNNGNGTFNGQNAFNDGGETFGGSWGDYDSDGDLDLFIPSVSFSTNGNNFLYNNNGNGTFTRVTQGDIVNDGGYSFGSCWGDYDNDGDLDLFVTNTDTGNFLYQNNGPASPGFTRITVGQIVTDRGWPYGAAWGDYDRDGDLDLFVAKFANENENNAFYQNEGNTNNWINIKCVGVNSNTSAIGAKVRVKAAIDFNQPVWQLREISTQTGYCGQNSLNAHFGLGNAATIDSLKIEWTSGLVEVWTDVDVNQFLTITEGSSVGIDDQNKEGAVAKKFELYQNYPNPFNPITTIKYDLPEHTRVVLKIYNALGQEVKTLLNEFQTPGIKSVAWNGTDDAGQSVSSGVYFYRIQTDDSAIGSQSKKMLLLK
jgi:hypothetical protein